MLIVTVAIVVAHGLFHLGAGHTDHRYRKAHGLSPNLYLSLGRGHYASVRLPGGFGVGHKL